MRHQRTTIDRKRGFPDAAQAMVQQKASKHTKKNGDLEKDFTERQADSRGSVSVARWSVGHDTRERDAWGWHHHSQIACFMSMVERQSVSDIGRPFHVLV